VSRWLPESISTYGNDVDFIFYLIYYITGISCILVCAALLYFVIKYRHKEGKKAIYTHGNTTLEIIWTIVPTLVFLMLGILSQSTWATVRYQLPETDYRVRVVGKQFNWTMYYPGPDGLLGTEDDFKEENLLNVPVNKPVRVVLSSEDVIHSFFLPNVRLKQDAVPGREIEVWFQVTKTGDFEIPCAELCGFGHSQMLGKMRVHAQSEFDEWARKKNACPAGVVGS